MSGSLIPPPPRIRFVDANGNMTRPWSDWLLNALLARVGGSAPAPSITELEAAINELDALVDGAAQAPGSVSVLPDHDHLLPVQMHTVPNSDESGRLQQLEAEVAALRQTVLGLQQGYQL